MLDFKCALQRVVDAYRDSPLTQPLPLLEAQGRYLAEDCLADIAVPGVDNSAMDGYAVAVGDIELDKKYAVSQRITAGDQAQPLQPGTVARLFTGAMLPAGADAVILQEDSKLDSPPGHVSFTELPVSGQHIRRAGQDIQQGALLVARGERLTPAQLGLLASTGVASVSCYRPLKAAFFSTGNELRQPGETLQPGQIYNSNRYALMASLTQLGVEVLDLGFCPDCPKATRKLLIDASERADCVITTGGMSVGEEDYVRSEAGALGQVDFWKIAIKPGKPFALGRLGDACFFGLPGNPVSAFVTFQLLVRPWLLRSMGALHWQHRCVQASANFDFYNKGRRMNFLRGNITATDSGELLVSKFDNQSSGVMSSIAGSNVLIPVEPEDRVEAQRLVTALPLVEQELLGASTIWPLQD